MHEKVLAEKTAVANKKAKDKKKAVAAAAKKKVEDENKKAELKCTQQVKTVNKEHQGSCKVESQIDVFNTSIPFILQQTC